MSLFPDQDEAEQRVRRARERMEAERLDALLLLTGPNLAYFAGPVDALGDRSGSRPMVLLLPRRGEPTLLVQTGPQFLARSRAWVRDIRTYSQLSRLPLGCLLQALGDHSLLNSRLGVELGNEMVMDIPASEFEALKNALARVEFLDASPLLWQLRSIKSEAEIERVVRACRVTAAAYSYTFSQIRPGMTEIDIEQRMLLCSIKSGGRSPWVFITSGHGNYDLIGKGGSNRVVEPGDLVWMDSGCTVDGYWSDFSRGCVLGEPTSEQVEAQAEIHEITCKAVEMVAPGVPVAEIARSCNQAVARLDLPVTSSVSGLAGRVGHGVGLNLTELPSLSEDDETLLQPGMIITVEPGVATTYGTFHVEEVILVTEQGRQVLSCAPWQLQAAKARPIKL
jgi:Xaa-Pro aminopeptidase